MRRLRRLRATRRPASPARGSSPPPRLQTRSGPVQKGVRRHFEAARKGQGLAGIEIALAVEDRAYHRLPTEFFTQILLGQPVGLHQAAQHFARSGWVQYRRRFVATLSSGLRLRPDRIRRASFSSPQSVAPAVVLAVRENMPDLKPAAVETNHGDHTEAIDVEHNVRPDLVSGRNPRNIVNLGSSNAGVQLEISRGLRSNSFLTESRRSYATHIFALTFQKRGARFTPLRRCFLTPSLKRHESEAIEPGTISQLLCRIGFIPIQSSPPSR